MIVLDTNVLSTIISAQPDEHVLRWLDAQPVISVWTTSITVFEIRLGLAILPRGRRRTGPQSGLETGLDQLLRDSLGGRVLPLDDRAAACAAEFAFRRRQAGRTVDMRDAMIAGIVIAQRGTLATRNLRHFDDPELRMLDPFDPRALEPDARWVEPPKAAAGRRRAGRVGS